MMVSAHRFRSIGWIALLLVCAALVMVLAFRVNALRSQVHRTEQQIIALRKEKLYLETEVETRANQQQLKIWNDVEFGYVAPSASQYLSSERQLAAFAKPDEPGAPAPIRVASADDTVAAEAAFPSMIAQLAGDPGISARPASATTADAGNSAVAHPAAIADDHDAAAAALGARLATVGPAKSASTGAAGKAGFAKAAKAEPRDGEKSRSSGKGTNSLAATSQSGARFAPKSSGKPAAAKVPKASVAKPGKPGKTTP